MTFRSMGDELLAGNFSSSDNIGSNSHRPSWDPQVPDAQLRDHFKRLKHERQELALIAFNFNITYAFLGSIATLLNVSIVIILLIHARRTILRHVFYLLMANFCVIDSIKGICLILASLSILRSPYVDNGLNRAQDKWLSVTLVKLDQIVLFILRFCSMATILNLLMITVNEYIFIRLPLTYNKWVNKSRVLLLALAGWALSVGFVTAQSVASSAAMGVYVSNDSKLIRRGDDLRVQTVFSFTLISFCFLCLAVVLVCYFSFFMVVHKIQRQDDQLKSQVRRMSQVSVNSFEHACALGAGTVASDERRHVKQLLRRYKYAIVIGLVIFVYMLYLLSYSAIQILYCIRLQSDSHLSKQQLLVAKSIRLLFGVHSVVQPLCYFRMREFRALVLKTCCACRHWRRYSLPSDRGHLNGNSYFSGASTMATSFSNVTNGMTRRFSVAFQSHAHNDKKHSRISTNNNALPCETSKDVEQPMRRPLLPRKTSFATVSQLSNVAYI